MEPQLARGVQRVDGEAQDRLGVQWGAVSRHVEDDLVPAASEVEHALRGRLAAGAFAPLGVHRSPEHVTGHLERHDHVPGCVGFQGDVGHDVHVRPRGRPVVVRDHLVHLRVADPPLVDPHRDRGVHRAHRDGEAVVVVRCVRPLAEHADVVVPRREHGVEDLAQRGVKTRPVLGQHRPCRVQELQAECLRHVQVHLDHRSDVGVEDEVVLVEEVTDEPLLRLTVREVDTGRPGRGACVVGLERVGAVGELRGVAVGIRRRRPHLRERRCAVPAPAAIRGSRGRAVVDLGLVVTGREDLHPAAAAGRSGDVVRLRHRDDRRKDVAVRPHEAAVQVDRSAAVDGHGVGGDRVVVSVQVLQVDPVSAAVADRVGGADRVVARTIGEAHAVRAVGERHARPLADPVVGDRVEVGSREEHPIGAARRDLVAARRWRASHLVVVPLADRHAGSSVTEPRGTSRGGADEVAPDLVVGDVGAGQPHAGPAVAAYYVAFA